MYHIKLRNAFFEGKENQTIFQSAKEQGVILEHSCLKARCRSCIAKATAGKVKCEGRDLVLSDGERAEGYILTCNSIPLSDLELDIEDLGIYSIPKSQTVPAKIESIESLTETVIRVVLRFPPSSKISFLPGQYVDIIKGAIRRSYSIANGPNQSGQLEFFIKRYPNGQMSDYWFKDAKPNDLLRVDGPFGTFFLRASTKKNLVFLATGTGIAPVKSILESLSSSILKDKHIYLYWGGRESADLFWEPKDKEIHYQKVLSRVYGEGIFHGYVQDALLTSDLDLSNTQVYACGSNEMINSARTLLIDNGLDSRDFYSDAFVSSN